MRPPTLRREYLDITMELMSRYSLYGATGVCGHAVLLLDRLAREGRVVYDQGSRRWRLVGVREGG